MFKKMKLRPNKRTSAQLSKIQKSIEKEIAEQEETIAHVLNYYNKGGTLFPRFLLQDIDRQIDSGAKSIFIPKLDGLNNYSKETSLTVPQFLSQRCDSYSIQYHSFEMLTLPSSPIEDVSSDPRTVSIVWHDSRREPALIVTMSDMQRTYRIHRREWKKSKTLQSLQASLASAVATSTFRIKKIVAFALGSFSNRYEACQKRTYWQHLALKSIASILEGAGHSNIRCYSQEPTYRDHDKEFLKSLKITPLDDPKAFLEVDSETLVFSVSPNVPVKQIIVDMQLPAAMIWDTVKSEPKEKPKWRKSMEMYGEENHETWVSPYSTDPDSPRVRKMIEYYLQIPIEDYEGNFSSLTTYIRQ